MCVIFFPAAFISLMATTWSSLTFHRQPFLLPPQRFPFSHALIRSKRQSSDHRTISWSWTFSWHLIQRGTVLVPPLDYGIT